MKTMRQLAKDAILILNAGNLTGMVNGFARILPDLEKHLREELGDNYSTQALCQHPVSVLFSQAISNVTHWDIGTNFSVAYNWAENQSETDERIAYPEGLKP